MFGSMLIRFGLNTRAQTNILFNVSSLQLVCLLNDASFSNGIKTKALNKENKAPLEKVSFCFVSFACGKSPLV